MEDQAMQALKLKTMVPVVYKDTQMFVEFDANLSGICICLQR